MPVSPTLNRAARILALVSPRAPADAVLRRELAPRRDLAPGERRETARAIAAYFRWLNWLDPKASPQRRLEAALGWQARFDANPAAIKPEALAARAVPGWLAAEMETIPAAWLRELQCEPALWIRARRQFAGSLPRALGDSVAASHVAGPVEPGHKSTSVAGLAEPGPGSATPATTAFRYTGSRDLYITDEFQRGQFEIQDLASQLVGCACNPQPGETWWDACAGEGGKTLHLADLMQNKGLIWASDRSIRRLHVLKQRTARAGVFNYRAVAWNGGPQPPTRTRFDGILVDAPCSGVGTWQRNPHARWTVSPADVHELAAVQRQLLDHVAGALKPGGRLIYAVCTLTRAETSGLAAEFSRNHPELESAPVFPSAGIPGPSGDGQPAVAGPARPPAVSCSPTPVQLWPQDLKANGMFIAAWQKRP
jgi:16S rRNA (cytosine967-C5)-methyltransferase